MTKTRLLTCPIVNVVARQTWIFAANDALVYMLIGALHAYIVRIWIP